MIFASVSIELAHPLIYLMLEIELQAFSQSVIFALFLNQQWETRIAAARDLNC